MGWAGSPGRSAGCPKPCLSDSHSGWSTWAPERGALGWGGGATRGSEERLAHPPPSDLPWPLQGRLVGLQGCKGRVSWPAAGFLEPRIEVLSSAVEPGGDASGKDPRTGLRVALVAGEGGPIAGLPASRRGEGRMQRKRAALEARVVGGAWPGCLVQVGPGPWGSLYGRQRGLAHCPAPTVGPGLSWVPHLPGGC